MEVHGDGRRRYRETQVARSERLYESGRPAGPHAHKHNHGKVEWESYCRGRLNEVL